MCSSLKACGIEAVEEVNRKLKTYPERMDQSAEAVAAEGKEAH